MKIIIACSKCGLVREDTIPELKKNYTHVTMLCLKCDFVLAEFKADNPEEGT